MNKNPLILSAIILVASAVALAKLEGRPEPSGKVTPWAAMKTAAAKTGGKPFQATYEFEEGKWSYAVVVVKDGKLSEVEIDANTGKVGDVEGVTPEGEAKEVKAEFAKAAKG